MKKEIKLAQKLDKKVEKQKAKFYKLKIKTARKFFKKIGYDFKLNDAPLSEGGFIYRDKYIVSKNNVFIAELHINSYRLILENENEELKRKCEYLFYVITD